MTPRLPSTVAVVLLGLLAASCSTDAPGGADGAGPLFTLLPSSSTGVTFANTLEEDEERNGFVYEYFYNGGGVAVGDLNGDDLPELYFTANQAPNRLYLNRGDLRFEDVTDRAGVAGHDGWTTGVTFADVNGDHRLDIHVSYSGARDGERRRNQLFIHQGTREGVPRFTEEAEAYGLDDRGMSTQAAFFDQDLDGDLDMYLMNHGLAGGRVGDAPTGGDPRLYLDRLYRNVDDRFVDVSAEVGLVETDPGFGLGLSVGDLDRDGLPDVYVANDYSGRDYLYLGRPGGRFEERLRDAFGHIPFSSMGSDMADVDGDGWMDLAVLDMAMSGHYDRMMSESGVRGAAFRQLVREGHHYQYPFNALQWNRGPGEAGVPVFSEIAHLAGVARTDWSWAALFADIDADGRPDLFATTGTGSDMVHSDFKLFRFMQMRRGMARAGPARGRLIQEMLELLPRRHVTNVLYRNEGDLTFRDRTSDWGLVQPSFSNGATYADLDRDGDLDLVVSNLMEEAFVYRNEIRGRRPAEARFLRLRLEGPPGNRFGVGARVRLKAGGTQQVQELQLTRGFQSSVEPVLHFGLGPHQRVDSLEVVWPDGSREMRTGVAADGDLTFEHTAAASRTPDGSSRPGPAFRWTSGALGPPAVDEAALGTGHPILQPYPSARDEVALAVGDVNGDGRDDVFFGGGGEEPSRVYLQQRDGSLLGRPVPAAGSEVGGPTAAATTFDADGDGRLDLWVSGADADPPATTAHRHRLHLGLGDGRFRVADGAAPADLDAGTVLAPGDWDGDGDMDLFVGGRSVPGPARPSRSHLLSNDAGVFHDVTEEVAPSLADLGRVTDATWTDLDGDGSLDLVVVGEWMPVTVLLHRDERLGDATGDAGLEDLTGWWQSVAAVDADGDGDSDVVAGNMGLNHPYRPTARAPLELYVHDFDGDRIRDAVPAYRPEGVLSPLFDRDRMSRELPFITLRFGSHDQYARASLARILGSERLASASRLEVRTLAHLYLENTGGARFTARPLPPAAQVSPVTGIVPGDFDGDGTLDLVIAGSIHALDETVPRADAGVGLLLRGDGAGGFEPVMPQESGLLIRGRVRRLVGVGSGSGGPPALLAGVAGGAAFVVRPASGLAAPMGGR